MKRMTSILLILFVIVTLSAQDQQIGLKRYAIFAGSNNGGDERVRLEYAESDALAMYEVLSEIGGLSAEDTIILSDPEVSDLRKAFLIMKGNIEDDRLNNRRSEFIFYYSGHSDESGILPGGNLYEYRELRSEIDLMGTDVKIAVLDSCSSGSFTRLKGGVKKAPFLIDESVDTKGHAFLTSSSENEAAQESDAIEGSYFTHYLISALRGAADSTQDGTVTLNEAYSFAADETLARTTSSIAGAQHPSYSINLTGSGDLVLTDLRENVSSISIAKEIDGRIFFRDSSERLVVEFRKRAGIPIAISLPSGVYKVELETEGTYATAMITVAEREVVLENRAFSNSERTFARIRGDEPQEENDEYDSVEESLENKMEEIRKIIDEKFSSNAEKEADKETEIPVLVESEQAPDLDYMVFGLSFTPSFNSSNDVRNLSLAFIGKPHSVYGMALGFMNMTYEDVYGVQIGALSSQTGRNQYGALISGIYNIANKDLWGTALSGIFNITYGTVYGFQGSGVFNLSYQKLMGMQASGVFNITKNLSYGAQAAGIFNITEGTMAGLQASGVFNISGGQFHGIQASGVFNVADNINGLQLSLVNVGGIVNGMQIGLININDDINGLPIGLITISKNGIMDFGAWYESSGFLYTGIQTGSKNFYNFAYVAFPTEISDSVLAAGIGIGARINIGPFYIDLDTSVKSVSTGTDYGNVIKNAFTTGLTNSIYPNARLSAGLKIFKVISIYGGMSLDMHIPGYTVESEYFHNSSTPLLFHDPQSGASIFELHPQWYGGLKINI